MYKELEDIIGYSFKNKQLLTEALTHPSLSFDKRKKRFNYERLEFLGDSILSFVIIEYLFKKHPNETEGELSKRKAFLVGKNTLYKIAKKLNLGKFMILSFGEENCGGRENVNNLENLVESAIGAIYLDSDFETVKGFILNFWAKLDEEKLKPPEDPKTELQNWSQKRFKKLPKYDVVDIGDSKNPCFLVKLEVCGHRAIEATGHSIKEIEEKLAEKMLKIVKSGGKK